MKRLTFFTAVISILSGPLMAESSHDIVVGLDAEKVMAEGMVLASASEQDKEGRVAWHLLVSYEGRVWDCSWFWEGPGVTRIVIGCYRDR